MAKLISSQLAKDAVKSAITTYEKMLKGDQDGIRPLYRLNCYMEEERRLATVQKKKVLAQGREDKVVAGAFLIIFV